MGTDTNPHSFSLLFALFLHTTCLKFPFVEYTTGFLLRLFVLRLFVLTPLTNLHYFLIYALSF